MSGDRGIELHGVRCPGRHGAYAGERDTVRTFLVDITARGNVDERDVEALAACARDAVAAGSRALLERVASEVALAILARVDGVAEVRVRVVKPHPPGLDADGEAVTVTRARRAARGPSA